MVIRLTILLTLLYCRAIGQNSIHDYDIVVDNGDYEYANYNEEYVALRYNQALTMEIAIKTYDNSTIVANWGDGSSSTIPSTNVEVLYSPTSKTFSSSRNGYVLIKRKYYDKIIGIRSTNNTFSFDIKILPAGLTYCYIGGNNRTIGNIANLPAGLLRFLNTGSNTTTGSIANLPSGLLTYNNQGSNTTSGSIGSLPAGLQDYLNMGVNTTTGDLSSLPSSLTYYQNGGLNTTSGSISSLPSGLTYYQNVGSNTTTGSIANLPAGLTYYYNGGNNTTSGSIANLPAGLSTYLNAGSNTTSGSIGSLPAGLTTYNNQGNNTTSGNIANLPAGLTTYYNAGQNTVSDYTGKIWANNQNTHFTRPVSGLSSSEVDQYLIDLANVLVWTGGRLVDLRGSNGARTAASDAAVSTLVSKGVTVLTN